MLELSDIQASPEELEDYYAQLRAQHVTPAWIGGGISLEPRSEAVPFVWHWRDLRPQHGREGLIFGDIAADFLEDLVKREFTPDARAGCRSELCRRARWRRSRALSDRFGARP